jgi:hypothetical protein
MDLRDIYGVFHTVTVQHMFFSGTQEIFFKTDHIIRHKTSPKKYKIILIIPCILSDHNEIKLELSNKRSSRK